MSTRAIITILGDDFQTSLDNHPDMTLTKKEEYLIIFQKINSAYEKLKK